MIEAGDRMIVADLRVGFHGREAVDRRRPHICLHKDVHELGSRLPSEAGLQLALDFVAIFHDIARIIAVESLYSDEFRNLSDGHHGYYNVSVARAVNAHGSAYARMPDSICAPLRFRMGIEVESCLLRGQSEH